MMTKEQIFDEFKIVKEKDLKKKTKDGKESYTHRIALLQSHAEAKSAHPNQYRHLDINFKNLVKMYESGDPDMYNWKKLGIEPYHIKVAREEAEEKEKKKKGIKDVKKDTIIESIDIESIDSIN